MAFYRSFFYFDPLEQFDIINIFSFYLEFLPTNLNFTLFLNFFLFFFIFFYSILDFMTNNSKSVFVYLNNRYTLSFNVFFWITQKVFVLLIDMLEENVALKKNSFVLIVFFAFLFLLISNLVGMIPFSYTITSSLILTFFLSLSFFIAINIIGFFHNKSCFFKTFLPGGTPIFIAPLLILIEIVSYFSRVFSLSIRLFANMMSGHALLKILIGFSWNAFIAGAFWFILSFLPWLVVTVVIGLELAIAVLQSYVFTILICIYINDSVNPH